MPTSNESFLAGNAILVFALYLEYEAMYSDQTGKGSWDNIYENVSSNLNAKINYEMYSRDCEL